MKPETLRRAEEYGARAVEVIDCIRRRTGGFWDCEGCNVCVDSRDGHAWEAFESWSLDAIHCAAAYLAERDYLPEQSFEPITEDWLREVGFKWHQFDRQPSKHWLLWLGDAMNGGGFSSFEDIGIEIAAGAWNQERDDHEDWFCWLRGDSAGRYHRFIHVRHIRTRGELIRIVEGLTNQDWDPANHHAGCVVTPKRAAWYRAERERADIRMRERAAKWASVEKDDTRGRALPEHMEAHAKATEPS